MIAAGLPKNEQDRIATLIGLNVLDTPAEDRFDRITRIAARLFHVPMSMVSLVDRDRQWFKSSCGLGTTQTERDVAFCAHAILGDDVMVVPDARKDVRFADNPLVTGEPHVRFYAGYPLTLAGGHKVGTLCVVDRKPREMNREEMQLLRDLGRMVEDELAAPRMSEAQTRILAERGGDLRKTMVDPLTRLWNREIVVEVLERELQRVQREMGVVSVMLTGMDHFNRILEAHGPQACDEALRHVARHMRLWTRSYDALGRYGGEEFLLVMPGCGKADASVKAEMIRRAVSEAPAPADGGKKVSVTLSAGVAEGRGTSEDLLRAALGALQRARIAGWNRVETA